MLRLGGLSLLGMDLPSLLQAEALPAIASGRQQAKSIILLYLFGGPAAQETFDPKTSAPSDYRGEFGTVPTSVPGVHFCEYLPRMARWMNRSTLIRSFTHESNDHSAGLLHTLTGSPPDKLESLVPALSPPRFGCRVSQVWAKRLHALGPTEDFWAAPSIRFSPDATSHAAMNPRISMTCARIPLGG